MLKKAQGRDFLSHPSVLCVRSSLELLQLFYSHEETKMKIKIIVLKRAEQKGRMYPVPWWALLNPKQTIITIALALDFLLCELINLLIVVWLALNLVFICHARYLFKSSPVNLNGQPGLRTIGLIYFGLGLLLLTAAGIPTNSLEQAAYSSGG